MGDLMLLLFALAMAFIVLFSTFGCAPGPHDSEVLSIPAPPIDDTGGG